MMSKNPTALRISLLLVLDTSLTVTVAFLSIFIYDIASMGQIDLRFGILNSMQEVLSDILTFDTFRIFLLASLFTSVWVWLYVLASVSIRILHRIKFVWVKIVPFLNVDKRPMIAIGRIAGLIAGFCYVAVLVGFWLYFHFAGGPRSNPLTIDPIRWL
jgi:hypothetical protein